MMDDVDGPSAMSGTMAKDVRYAVQGTGHNFWRRIVGRTISNGAMFIARRARSGTLWHMLWGMLLASTNFTTLQGEH